MRCILLSKEQKYNCSAFSLFGDSAFAITHLLKCICKFKMDTHGFQSFVDLCRAVKHWRPLGFLPHAPSQDPSGNTLPSGFSSQTGMTRGWRSYPEEQMELNMISGSQQTGQKPHLSFWCRIISVLMGSSGTELCPGFNPVPQKETLAFRGWDTIDPLSATAQGASFVAILRRNLFFGKM